MVKLYQYVIFLDDWYIQCLKLPDTEIPTEIYYTGLSCLGSTIEDYIPFIISLMSCTFQDNH